MTHITRSSVFTRAIAVAAAVAWSVVPFVASAAFGDTTTYVSRIYYGDGKDRLLAFFDFPEDIAADSSGNFYLADTFNHVVRKINSSGVVSTVAGTGSYGDVIGAAANAEFAYPRGVAVGSDGAVYVADSENGKIKKIKNGSVTTLVSGLNKPEAVAVNGSTLFFLDTGNNMLKKVSVNGGSVTTLSGSLSNPKKLAVSSDAHYAYIANAGTAQVKRVDLSTTAVTTTAGTGDVGADNGSCSEATFENVWGIHLVDDTVLYVSDGDGFSDTVRKIDLEGCTVETFASDFNMVSINFPRGLTSYDGALYVVATGIGIVQKYDLTDPNVNEKFAGANRFNVKSRKPVLVGNPKFMVLSNDKKTIYFSENNRIRSIRRGNLRRAPLIAGDVIDNYNKDDNDEYVGVEARFSDVASIALSRDGTRLFVVDRNNSRIKEVVIATKAMRYLTGAGRVNSTSGQTNDFADGDACPNEKDKDVAGCAYFDRPTGSALSPDGKYLYVADSGNDAIRRVVVRGPNKGKVTTIAGTGVTGFVDGEGGSAQFSAPVGVALNKKGTVLYVADRDNQRIRKIRLSDNRVSTYAGTGSNGYLDAVVDRAVLSYPEWITMGVDGHLYFGEVGSNRIRMIDRTLGVTKLVSGSGNRGFTNGSRMDTRFNNPKGLLALKKKVLVAELYNDVIRSITIEGDAPYTDPAPTVSSVVPQKIAKEWFTGNSASVEVRGTNFRNGATATLGSYAANMTYVNSSTVVVVDMPIADMPAGYYTIRIQNSDGQYDDIIRGLAVSENGVVPDVDYWPQ